MVKGGLEKITLKFHVLLQRYLLNRQANSALLGRFFCTGWQQLGRGMWNFKIFFSRPLFTITFKPKMVIARLNILVLILAVLGGVCNPSKATTSRWIECFFFNCQYCSGNPICPKKQKESLNYLCYLTLRYPSKLRYPLILQKLQCQEEMNGFFVSNGNLCTKQE